MENRLVLAPMAGVTDRPFRQLCRNLGAGLTVSEMISANPQLLNTRKSKLRRDHVGEPGPVVVQIAGSIPQQLAQAARFNVDNGAQIIDINMGCPKKKVCKRDAGSALLRDEKLVQQILSAVTRAVSVPVTLKIRTGWDKQSNNAVSIARIAEQCGVQALTVHGRSRACGFTGVAEYATVTEIKQAVQIPVIANGDIDSPARANAVFMQTGVDAIMIGRAAQGNPWIFKQIDYFLNHGNEISMPTATEVAVVLKQHVAALHEFYGEYTGVRVARKHISWYCKNKNGSESFRTRINRVEDPVEQLRLIDLYFSGEREQQAA